jgi:hypothetical protein
MKLPRALYPLFGWGILLAVTATSACDLAPIDITGTWVAQPVLMDSGWCRTTWTFSENEKWRALHVFSDDSAGTIIIRREQSFGLWLIEPSAEHRVGGRESSKWQLALMVTGIERQSVKGFSVDMPWVPNDSRSNSWAHTLSPGWPNSYGLIQKPKPDVLDLTLRIDGLVSLTRRLERKR